MPQRLAASGIDVPVSAVFSPDESGKSYVWVIDQKTKTVKRREVEAGKLTDAAADLERTDAERRNALLRARASVAVITLGVLLAAAWLSRGPRRAHASGTG